MRDAPGHGRFEALDGEELAAAAYYLDVDEVRRDTAAADPDGGGPGRERIFYHTVVEDAWSGKGLASRLVRFALEETVRAGLGIVPVCPFVKAWTGRHPEYRAHTHAVRREHLDALSQR
nr:GNAT family N-acetyltransferase [Kineococcus aurantiacus]